MPHPLSGETWDILRIMCECSNLFDRQKTARERECGPLFMQALKWGQLEQRQKKECRGCEMQGGCSCPTDQAGLTETQN